MSKFTEFLRLIPKSIPNADKIIEGWINDAKLNNGNLSEEDTETILIRRSICSQCPLNSFNCKTDDSEYQKLFGEPFKTDRIDEHCSVCSCPIQKKTASLHDNCGLFEYNVTHKNNPQELKWTAKQ